ncbi:glycoside hydrolase family 3 protein [bacterium]|nr:glycoside hydrolase family 3 protein [bacterium]
MNKAVFGFSGSIPDKNFIDFIEKAQPYGFIIFEHNFISSKGLKKTIKNLRSICPKAMFMIDEEGGEKSRLRLEHGFPNPPNPRELPSSMTPLQVREAYRTLGNALADLGIDINLAPVVDVASEGHILGGRALSDNPYICAEYAVAIIEGLFSAGIKPCAKHFPGLGSADIDPHLGVSFAGKNEDFWLKHFIPYKSVIEAAIPYIMTTHLVAKKLDPSGKIATYSSKIINIIREDLGFTGSIISDDLFMGGAQEYQSLEDRVKKTLDSGHDIVLICKEFEGQTELL